MWHGDKFLSTYPWVFLTHQVVVWFEVGVRLTVSQVLIYEFNYASISYEITIFFNPRIYGWDGNSKLTALGDFDVWSAFNSWDEVVCCTKDFVLPLRAGFFRQLGLAPCLRLFSGSRRARQVSYRWRRHSSFKAVTRNLLKMFSSGSSSDRTNLA